METLQVQERNTYKKRFQVANIFSGDVIVRADFGGRKAY
jgi:hypothetical protein